MKKVALIKEKRRGLPVWSAVSALAFIALAVFMLLAFDKARTATEEEGLQVTRRAIIRASVSCYAVEGFYPDSLEYLEEHYGVIVDHSRYVVEYDAAASNLLPSVTVSAKGSDRA